MENGSDNGLTRRHAIGAAGAVGTAFLIGGVVRGSSLLDGGVEEAAAATCVMTPAKTVGPYFVDEKLNRRDIREDQAGVPLALTMFIFDADNDCAPVSGAQVDIWHANAGGLYSDESANGTSGQKWLRGYQTSDAEGKVTFETIYPGWYRGRAIHIHFKVRKGTLEFISQLFFTDDQNAQVMKQSPYNSRGNPDTTDSSDNIYGSDGSSLLLRPQSDGNGGYTADFSVGIAGGSSGTSTSDDVVNASLVSVKALRTTTGARRIRVRLKATEAITAALTVTRAGKTVARLTRELTAGTHTLNVAVPRRVSAGAATVRVKLTDASKNTKTATRTVHVPALRKS